LDRELNAMLKREDLHPDIKIKIFAAKAAIAAKRQSAIKDLNALRREIDEIAADAERLEP
jgi:hypothetical protein